MSDIEDFNEIAGKKTLDSEINRKIIDNCKMQMIYIKPYLSLLINIYKNENLSREIRIGLVGAHITSLLMALTKEVDLGIELLKEVEKQILEIDATIRK